MSDARAVQIGTYDAVLDIMDATGKYPMTRADVLAAITEGVRQAHSEHLARTPACPCPTLSAEPLARTGTDPQCPAHGDPQ